MKKTLIGVIVAAVAAMSVYVVAAENDADKAKKNADLDSIYQTVQQSRHELAMMQHVAAALESGATIEEIHEHFQEQSKKRGGHDVQQLHEAMKGGVHAGMKMPKLKGSHQDKLNQLGNEAEELQKLIRALHQHMAEGLGGG